jgi:hypothetical protein
LPEGWIEEAWLAATGESFPTPTEGVTGTVGHYWYTWFTGVFSLHEQKCGIWCPGGPLKSCVETLEIRPREN